MCCDIKKTSYLSFLSHPQVMGSIQDNITEDVLLPEIESVCTLPIYEEHMSEVHRQQKAKMHAKQHHQQHHHKR